MNQYHDKCIALANELLKRYSQTADFTVQLSYMNRKHVVGRAFFDDHLIDKKICKIQINETRLKLYGEPFLDEIVRHEVAHVITACLHPEAKQSHGKEWKRIVASIGGKPSRFISREFSSNTNSNRQRAECHCCIQPVGPIVAKRIAEGKRYSCLRCGVTLRLCLPVEDKHAYSI